MKKVFKAVVTIALLLAVVFLAGEWPENTTRAKVILCDGCALLTIIISSLYLRATGAFKKEGK